MAGEGIISGRFRREGSLTYRPLKGQLSAIDSQPRAARGAAAVLAGLLLTSAFPPFSWSFAAAFGLIPLLWAIQDTPWPQAARLGLLCGITHFGTLIPWLAHTIVFYGRLPAWASWGVLGLLVWYLAVYPAVWAGLAAWCCDGKRRRFGEAPGARHSGPGVFSFLVFLAGTWVLLEWLRGHLLSGFPWGLLAYALTPHPALIQTAEYWGPYGVSFFVVLINGLIWQALAPALSTETGKGLTARFAWVLMAAVLVTALWGYGTRRLKDIAAGEKGLPTLRVAALQGAIPQEQKWDPVYQTGTLQIYEDLSLAATGRLRKVASGTESVASLGGEIAELLVWPETATPFYFQEPSPLQDRVLALARQVKGAVLFGSPAYRVLGWEDTENQAAAPRGVAYLNSAYLIGPAGEILGRYDKQHLVPFGEYLPWGWVTEWAEGLLPTAGVFTSGVDPRPLVWQNARIGVLICFESIFPELSAGAARAGANLLVVITNDAWFGRTGAPYQHAAMAAFRAVETRRWVVRAANTGVSLFMTPWGEELYPTAIFKACWIGGVVSLRQGQTFYTRWGDVGLVALGVLTLLACWRTRHG